MNQNWLFRISFHKMRYNSLQMMQCVSYVAVQNKDLITMVEKKFILHKMGTVQYRIYYFADHEVSNQNFGFTAISNSVFWG